MNITKLLNSLSAARMEYESIDYSVLNRFVVPFKIDQLDLRNQNISIALVGSRGSGKSTYIQYFSHATRFDKSLPSVEISELECIVLYWKPDIAYCQGLNESWLGVEHAERFFMNHASIEIIGEFMRMISNVQYHFPEQLIKVTYEDSNILRALKNISNNEIESLEQVERWIDDQRFDLSTRLNPINIDGMLSLDPKTTLNYLINNFERDCPVFKNTRFKIFIDEFELLNESQQIQINSYRKDSKAKISWNVAYKLHAKTTRETRSNQPLQEPDDFITEVLDDLIKDNFALYAAEIFLLSVKSAGIDCSSVNVNAQDLGDRNKILDRENLKYREKVLGAIKKLLPTPKVKELSSDAYLSSSWLRKKVKDIVDNEGRERSLIDRIMLDTSMAVTIVGTYLQKSFNLDMFLNGGASSDDKINTYEFNSLLTFRNQNSQLTLPVYSGFDRFIAMTTPNVRHFKVLCFNSLKQLDEKSKSTDISFFEEIQPITPEKMDYAAVTTSKLLVDEIISYPPYGNKLYMLVNRIGELFKTSQKSSYQTEPERDIFAIKYDYANSEPEMEDILSAGEAWKVLISDDSKRLKSDSQYTSKEYVLNPIFSPKFGISYRKKRGIVFDLEEFKILINGSSDDFDKIRNKYRKSWKCDSTISNENADGQMKDQGTLL
ncbi:MAG: hypothetical protein JKY50_07880 [Oleispira sp.]|nr:hypothetical protein [Oleispira sp.]MBL4880213.1 hypothetical protein [Oleispira sp.]